MCLCSDFRLYHAPRYSRAVWATASLSARRRWEPKRLHKAVWYVPLSAGYNCPPFRYQVSSCDSLFIYSFSHCVFCIFCLCFTVSAYEQKSLSCRQHSERGYTRRLICTVWQWCFLLLLVLAVVSDTVFFLFFLWLLLVQWTDVFGRTICSDVGYFLEW